VSEHYRIIESVKIGNLSTTLPTLRPLNPTRYSNNVVATVVDLYIQHRDIRYIQQDCDLRFDRFALLLLSISILSHLGQSPITTIYWGLHGNYQRTTIFRHIRILYHSDWEDMPHAWAHTEVLPRLS
jgi:hypothetical protein